MSRPKAKKKPARETCRLCDEFGGRPVVIVIAGNQKEAAQWIHENRARFTKAHYASGSSAFCGFNSCTSRVALVGTWAASENGRQAETFARTLALPQLGAPCRRCK